MRAALAVGDQHRQEALHEPEVDCCHFGDRRRAGVCAGSTTERSEGDQGGRAKCPQIISSNKAKTQTYCDRAKLGDQIAQAGEKQTQETDGLYQKWMIGDKTGSRICRVDARASGH